MSSSPKSYFLDAVTHDYLLAHSTPLDEIANDLILETNKLGGIAIMQISPEQGMFMAMLAKLIGARRAVEVGTFTGFSALCVARSLPSDGRLLCCDVSEEWTSIGRRYWEKAGVADRIDLRIAPAADTLRALPLKRDIDISFIDADKQSYPVYWDEIVKRTRPGGVVLVDNVLRHGGVTNPDDQNEVTQAIRDFNDLSIADDRVECVMLPIGDGLTLARVL
jgi:caffeoyl-CoA O-methyltransferase